MWNCVSPFKPPAECVFPSNCSPLLCHLPSDSSLSIWVLFWRRQLLSHFEMPRADKQALDWECMFLWSQHCILTLRFIYLLCMCVRVCVYIEVQVVHISVVLNALIVYDLGIDKGCLYSEVKDTHSVLQKAVTLYNTLLFLTFFSFRIFLCVCSYKMFKLSAQDLSTYR